MRSRWARRSGKAVLLSGILLSVIDGRCLGESTVALPRETTNGMSLQVCTVGPTNGSIPVGAYRLTAFGQALLSDLPAWHPTNGTVSAKVVESVASINWEYVRLDLTPVAGQGYARWHRHLLFVAPDLFVIFDDADLAKAAPPRANLSSPGMLLFDPKSKDFRLETKAAGLTAHVFAPTPIQFESWQSNRFDGQTTFTTQSTNDVAQWRVLTLMVPHETGRKGGTGFKLLESDTAIGARIWRNGLPTLIAFRTAPSGSGADLASMPVAGSVAVDVFDPSALRKRKAPPAKPAGS